MSLSVHNLKKVYGDGPDAFVALDDVSVDIDTGTIFGVIGRSGAGKTTLLRCLNGLVQPDSGSVKISGANLSKAEGTTKRGILQNVGTVFQSYNLLSRQTVYNNIAFPLQVRGDNDTAIAERVRWLSDRVGLTHKLHDYPSQLSGGQCQRVAIARALAANPDVLLCDEFTAALDPETAFEILGLLRQLNDELNITVFLITHDMSVVREICDEVAVMDAGKIVEQDSVENILIHPQHPVTNMLLKSLFEHDLPNALVNQMKEQPSGFKDDVVLRLVFSGEAAGKPLIAEVMERYKLQVNIIAGGVDHFRETGFGSLTISIPYNEKQTSIVKTFFAEHNVKLDIVGFVPHD